MTSTAVLVCRLIVAGIPPNVTEVTESNPVPVIKTTVPPPAGPLFGVIADTTGGGVADVVAAEPLKIPSFTAWAAALP